MWYLFLILTACPLGIGGITFHYATKEGASLVKAFAVALLAGIVGTGVVLWAVNECMLASYLRGEVRARLAPEELDTLRAEGLICPTAYSFERGGKRASAFVLDGGRGAEVYIGTD